MAKEEKKRTKTSSKKENKSGKKEEVKKVTKKIEEKKPETRVEKKKGSKERSKGKEVMQRIETSRAKESRKMLIILVCVIAVLGAFYLIAGIATGSIDLNKNEPAEIQYSEILAGSTFKQSDTEYIVLYYDFTTEKASDYASLISTYTQKEDAYKLYTVDLSRKFNASYIQKEGEKANTNPTSASELKVKEPTLIKIKDKKVEKYYESYEDIENYMS